MKHEEFLYKDRIYKVPIILPIIVSIGSFYLIVAPVIRDASEDGWSGCVNWIKALAALFSGLIFYLPMKKYNRLRPARLMKALTLQIQRIMQVAPSEVMPEDI